MSPRPSRASAPLASRIVRESTFVATRKEMRAGKLALIRPVITSTQRPSVDVITGLIKANFPARISFRVATKVDSRTILDANGAEALLGRGDMLYLPSGSARVHRLHAPFVTEKEIAAVVEFWKSQASAEYEQKFLEPPKEEREAGEAGADETGEGDNDPLFNDAVRLVGVRESFHFPAAAAA